MSLARITPCLRRSKSLRREILSMRAASGSPMSRGVVSSERFDSVPPMLAGEGARWSWSEGDVMPHPLPVLLAAGPFG